MSLPFEAVRLLSAEMLFQRWYFREHSWLCSFETENKQIFDIKYELVK